HHTTDAAEYAAAMRSVRLAKNILWLLLGLAIVIQLVSFVLVEFVGVIDDAPNVRIAATDAPAAEAALEKDVEAATCRYDVLSWLLPATKFLGVVTAMLLALTLLVAMKVSLVGRLGGVAGFVSAFFWSLILLAFVMPWQQILSASFARGVLYNLGQLVKEAQVVKVEWGATDVPWWDEPIYYARFIAYPAVAILVWLAVQVKFARGLKATRGPAASAAAPSESETT
ncbi:MAG: hypothetical protein KAU28_06035, partial [Phycisphaerae bacterium]|nr:hypothetical protein [Phycisphaerae bacterium]